jgi:hypothetical protein
MNSPAAAAYAQTGRAGCNQPTNDFTAYRQVARHIGSQSTDKDARMYPSLKPGTSIERSRRVTKQSALRLVPLALDAAVGEKSSPIKRVAKAADVDYSTAKSWMKGHNLPSSHHLLSLMIAFPEFYAEVRRIIAMEANLHEDLQRDIAALIQKAMAR